MVYKKKKGRGVAATGRDPAATEDITFSNLDPDKKREYFRQHMQDSRAGSAKETEAKPSSSGLTSGKSIACNEEKDDTPPRLSLGRPPLGDNPMTPNTLKSRKRELYHKKSEESLSKKRANAVKIRWQPRMKVTSPCHDNSDSELEEMTLDSDDEPGELEELDPDETNQYDWTSMAGKKKLQRITSSLLTLLPSHELDSLHLFVRSYDRFGADDNLKAQLLSIVVPDGNMNQNQLRYRSEKIHNIVEPHQDISSHLFRSWLSQLLSHPNIAGYMEATNIIFPAEIMPKKFHLTQTLKLEREKLLTCASNSTTSLEQRHVGIQLAINVVKASKISNSVHGDTSALAEAVGCSFPFAKKVIEAVEKGEESSLLKRNMRCDTLLGTDWPSKLKSYVIQPENSRAVPGKEQVSIRYGVRHAKFVLLKSKQEIAENLKKLYPDCEFKTSTLIREFPPYAVTATARDTNRNTCPIHANVRHIVKSVNKLLKKEKIDLLPASCRQLSTTIMCSNDFVTNDPLSWKRECAMRECEECPKFTKAVTAVIRKKDVQFSQWKSVKSMGKNKKGEDVEKNVFGIYSETSSFEDVMNIHKEQWRDSVSTFSLHTHNGMHTTSLVLT